METEPMATLLRTMWLLWSTGYWEPRWFRLMAPPLLFQTVFCLTILPSELLFWSMPYAMLAKDRQHTTRCTAPVPAPPSLNPLPLPCQAVSPKILVPCRNAQQLVMSTGCEPSHRSQPSSAFSHERQPLNTLPGPRLHFALNPSAFWPWVAAS